MLYRVVERRMLEEEYLIEAENEQAARSLDGEIIEDNVGESAGYEIVSVEEA